VFVVMLIKAESTKEKIHTKNNRLYLCIGAAAVFFFDLVVVLQNGSTTSSAVEQPIKDIAVALIDTNGFLLEMASLVLLAGLVTAIFVGSSFINRKNKVAKS